jgi:copper chaperone CopZ
MTTIKIKVEDLSCPSCLIKIETALKEMQGVKRARGRLVTRNIKTTFDEKEVTEAELKERIEELGYPVIS